MKPLKLVSIINETVETGIINETAKTCIINETVKTGIINEAVKTATSSRNVTRRYEYGTKTKLIFTMIVLRAEVTVLSIKLQVKCTTQPLSPYHATLKIGLKIALKIALEIALKIALKNRSWKPAGNRADWHEKFAVCMNKNSSSYSRTTDTTIL